jgi:hypothetical protein
MPLLKRKAVEDLIAGKDHLYSRAGNFAKAGAPVTDSIIQRLLRHRVPVVTAIYPSREESTRGRGKADIEAYVAEKETEDFALLRGRLFECAKKIYKPYGELANRAFWGKLGEKLIKPDFLLERQPVAMYRQGIYLGSLGIYGSNDSNNQYNDQKAVLDCLDALYLLFDVEETPRLYLDSIRLGAIYDAEIRDRVRILDPGNSFAWHATDTAILCLAALVSMSRRRKAEGLPESTMEFEKQKNRITSHKTISVRAERFYYPKDTIIDAALGCLLHGLGFAHLSVNRIASKRPLLDDSAKSQAEIKTLRKSQWAVRNLFEERGDVSAIAKKIIFQMKQYPDGAGYPPPEGEELPFIPEYARMAELADDYDELLNPVLSPHPMGRTEALRLLASRCGDYSQSGPSARYDKVLLDEFLRILKPFETSERVDLYLEGKRSNKYYSGFASGYEASQGCLPQICVLKNAVEGESYAFGRVLFDLEAQRVLLLDEAGKLGAAIERADIDERDGTGGFKIKNAKIREMLRQLPDLVALDDLREAWSPEDYRDPVFEPAKPKVQPPRARA